MIEVKAEYTRDEIITHVELLAPLQRTTVHNVKVLFAMHNYIYPNNKEYTTSCISCVKKVKQKLQEYAKI